MVFEYLENKKEKEHDETLLSISSIGGCKMKIFLEKLNLYKEEYDESLKRVFRTGDAFHSLIYNEIIEKSYNSGVHIIASELDVKDINNHIKGRIDCLVSDGKENIILDIKSCSDWSFKKYIDELKIPQQYIIQIQLYLHILKLNTGVLLFVNKNNSRTGEVIIKYNKEFVENLLKEINKFYNDLNNNIPPQCCDGGEWGCRACEYYKNNESEILEKLKNLK